MVQREFRKVGLRKACKQGLSAGMGMIGNNLVKTEVGRDLKKGNLLHPISTKISAQPATKLTHPLTFGMPSLLPMLKIILLQGSKKIKIM